MTPLRHYELMKSSSTLTSREDVPAVPLRQFPQVSGPVGGASRECRHPGAAFRLGVPDPRRRFGRLLRGGGLTAERAVPMLGTRTSQASNLNETIPCRTKVHRGP